MNKNENVMDANFEPLDDDLKMMLGNMYQDESELFTPEAQEKRRNNRLMLTAKCSVFMASMCFFATWAHSIGMISTGWFGFCISAFSIVVGYNLGVCVCHNKGWRGA